MTRVLILTHPELVTALVKPPLDIQITLTEGAIDLWHGATGVAGECGELVEAFNVSSVMMVDRDNVIEELGDLYFYMEQLRQRTGLPKPTDIFLTEATDALPLDLDDVRDHVMNAVIYGLQVLDTVKKMAIYNRDLNLFMLEDQLTRLSINLHAVERCMAIVHDDVLHANIVKLATGPKARYKGAVYSDEAAHARADKVADLAPPQPRTSDMHDVVSAEKSA